MQVTPLSRSCEVATLPLSDAALVPQARSLTARYDFLAELGRGGMGIVYLARERVSGSQVAIKLLGSSHVGDTEAALRFAREARTVAALDDPHILRTLAIEELDGGGLAIVSEYVDGRTLRSLLRESGPLPFERAASLLRDVASALAHAHEYRVVHRDVKPENIFIEAASGRALLADFGIARPLDTDTLITSAGSSLGTPSYMAPEQVRGASVDERTDVYALGLVGWEMIAGMRPWEGETLYEVLHKQQHQPLPSLADLRPDIPAYLLSAIEGATRKRPEERWANAHLFLAHLTPTPVARPAVPANDRAAVLDAQTVRVTREPTPTAAPVIAPPSRPADESPAAPIASSARDPDTRLTNTMRLRRMSRGPLYALAAALIVAVGVVIFASTRMSGDGTSAWYASGRAATPSRDQVRFEDTASGRLPATPPALRRSASRDSALRASAARDSIRRDALRRDSLRRDVAQRDSVRLAVARRDSLAALTAARDSLAAARAARATRTASSTPPTGSPVPSAASTDADAPCRTPTDTAQRACLMAAIDRNDVDLNRTYQSLIGVLRREAGGVRESPAVRGLRVEQRAWLVQRDRACRRSAAGTSGSLWGAQRAPCFATMSEQREAVLRARLESRTARDSG